MRNFCIGLLIIGIIGAVFLGVNGSLTAFAQTKPQPEKYCQATEIFSLPGGLNDVPCFNSNSPELVLKEGILLSTFPPAGMKHPNAHLNMAFDGRFDLFSHHVAKNETSEEDRTLFLGFIANNPNNKKVQIRTLSGASYLSQPDAPFIPLADIELNDEGKIFAGPGDRVSQDLLKGEKPSFVPENISLEPGQTKLMFCLPIPVRDLKPALNGRSTLLRMKSSGPVYIATLARFVGPGTHKTEASASTPPQESEWLHDLKEDDLATPRDETPTPPHSLGHVKYGRVSGVAHGNEWAGTITDKNSDVLNVPQEGKSFTYPISTVEGSSFGTKQVQSAPMLVRYPDTAYEAHGNYGLLYSLNLPLHNNSARNVNVQLLFQSAIKSDESDNKICFYKSPPARVFFRGEVSVYDGKNTHFWHLVQKQGAEGAKIAEITLPPGARQDLEVKLIYPPDSTPPQELSIRTVGETQD